MLLVFFVLLFIDGNMNCSNDTAFENVIDQLCSSYLAEDGSDCQDAKKMNIIMMWVIFNIITANSNYFVAICYYKTDEWT